MMYIRLKSWLCQDVAVTQLGVKLSRLCPTLQAWYLTTTNCYVHVLQDPYELKNCWIYLFWLNSAKLYCDLKSLRCCEKRSFGLIIWNSVQPSSKNLLFTIARICNHQVNHWWMKHIYLFFRDVYPVFTESMWKKRSHISTWNQTNDLNHPRQVCAMGGWCSWRWRRSSNWILMTFGAEKIAGVFWCCEWYATEDHENTHTTCRVETRSTVGVSNSLFQTWLWSLLWR